MAEELITELGIDNRRFNKELRESNRDIEKFEKSIKQTERAGDGLARKLGGGLVGGFNKLGSSMGSVVSTGGKLAGLMAGGMAAGVLGIGAGLGAAAASGLGFNNSMEKVTAQLNAFTKDGAKSAEILEMIKDRASKTPFEFEAMAKATVSLMSSAKQAKEPLEALVKEAEILAASNPAEGLEGAAFALKEAVSGDFTSIIERFNLPRQMINKLKEEGVPAREIVRRAMKEMGLDTDLVSNLANTAEGRWSTLKDTFTTLAGEITKPIFDTASSGLGKINEWLTANEPMITKFGQDMAGVVSEGISKAAGFLGEVAEKATGFWTAMQSGDPETVKAFFEDIGGWAGKLGPFFVDAALGFGQWLDEVSKTEPVKTFRAAWDELWANNDTGIKVHSQEWHEMYAENKGQLTEFQKAWDYFYVEVVKPLTKMKNEFVVFYNDATAGLTEFGKRWDAYWTESGKTLQAFVNGWDSFFFGVRASLTDFTTNWNNFWQLLETDQNASTTRWDEYWTETGTNLAQFGADWTSFWTNVGNGLAGFQAGFAQFWRDLGTQIRAFVEGADEIGRNLVEGIKSGIQSAWNGLVSFFTGLVGGLIAAGKAAIQAKSPSRLAQIEIGEPIPEGIKAGISGMWGALVSDFTGKLDDLVSGGGVAGDKLANVWTMKTQTIEAINQLHLDKLENAATMKYQTMQAAAAMHEDKLANVAAMKHAAIETATALHHDKIANIQAMKNATLNAAAAMSMNKMGTVMEEKHRAIQAAAQIHLDKLANYYSMKFGEIAGAAWSMAEAVLEAQRRIAASPLVTATGTYYDAPPGGGGGAGGGGSDPVPMARGGITTGITPALLHPNEAVIPLDRLPMIAGGGGGTTNIYIDGILAASVIDNKLGIHKAATSRLPVSVGVSR
jgi:hypothetical protein